MNTKDPELMDRIKEYISGYYREYNGLMPTITQISNAMGVVRSTAYKYLVAMDKKGMISYQDGRISIPDMGKIIVESEQVDAVGAINCGEPALDENNENTLKRYAGIDKESHKVVLEYMNQEVYPDKKILISSLICQGVLSHVIKAI
ncbi:LexA family transcriptional regulator [Eubacterium limosum]|nr:LexA family transcriptional regulator [Eubacterium limosum]